MINQISIEADNPNAIVELYYMTRDPDILHLCRGIAALHEPQRFAVGLMIESLLHRQRAPNATMATGRLADRQLSPPVAVDRRVKRERALFAQD